MVDLMSVTSIIIFLILITGVDFEIQFMRKHRCPVCDSDNIKPSKTGYGGYETYCSKSCAAYGRIKCRSDPEFEEFVKEELLLRELDERDISNYECECGRKFTTSRGLSRHTGFTSHRAKRPRYSKD